MLYCKKNCAFRVTIISHVHVSLVFLSHLCLLCNVQMGSTMPAPSQYTTMAVSSLPLVTCLTSAGLHTSQRIQENSEWISPEDLAWEIVSEMAELIFLYLLHLCPNYHSIIITQFKDKALKIVHYGTSIDGIYKIPIDK